MELSSEPNVWWVALCLVGGMFLVYLIAFALMHATVRPRDEW